MALFISGGVRLASEGRLAIEVHVAVLMEYILSKVGKSASKSSILSENQRNFLGRSSKSSSITFIFVVQVSEYREVPQ